MLLNCKACDGPLKADDIDIRSGIAKCDYCNAVMRFTELTENDSGKSENTPAERASVPMPSGVQMEEWGGALRITRRWFTPIAFFLLFFCIAWDSFLIFWYSMAFGGGAPWIFKLFPIVHVAVGVGLTYFTIALFLNRTVLAVENDQLTIKHGPVPWPGNQTLETAMLKQFYCEMKIRNGKNGPSITYVLNAVTSDGQKKKIVSGLNDEEQALFLEQQLERHLRITDEPVKGELAR